MNIRLGQRRGALRILLGFTPALLLAGCEREARMNFHAIVAGSDFEPGFELPDFNGDVRRQTDFRGKVTLVFFGFTRCPSVCPTSLARAAQVRQLLGAQADRLQVIFISLDPSQDTDDILHEYLGAFDPSFIGLRGTEDQTAATARAFKVFYRRVPLESGGYTMDHTALSYAFDTQGRLRLIVGHELTAQQVADDVRSLLAEASSA